MSVSVMASQTTFLKNPSYFSPLNTNSRFLFSRPKPTTLSLRRPQFHPLCISLPKLTYRKSKVFASSSTLHPNPTINKCEKANLSQSLLTGSTRTITTVLALAVSISKLFAHKILSFAGGICPGPNELMAMKSNMVCTMGPMFFAALDDRPAGSLNTPLTVIAAGMAKWLDIYSGVLMVRVLLSWFPNIPWDRQPLSAIRDLCDPYLNLFRNIIPPIFDTLDVSPLLAFAVLGTLGSILNSSRGAY